MKTKPVSYLDMGQDPPTPRCGIKVFKDGKWLLLCKTNPRTGLAKSELFSTEAERDQRRSEVKKMKWEGKTS